MISSESESASGNEWHGVFCSLTQHLDGQSLQRGLARSKDFGWLHSHCWLRRLPVDARELGNARPGRSVTSGSAVTSPNDRCSPAVGSAASAAARTRAALGGVDILVVIVVNGGDGSVD